MLIDDDDRSSAYNHLPTCATDDLLSGRRVVTKAEKQSIFAQWRDFIAGAIAGLNLARKAAKGEVTGLTEDLQTWYDAAEFMSSDIPQVKNLASLARGFQTLATDRPSRPGDIRRAIDYAAKITDNETRSP
jgi:hypothetical protein